MKSITVRNLLATTQNCIQELYELDVPYEVFDFVTTSEQFAQTANRLSKAHSAKEQLYVVESDQHLELSLYLDENLLGNLIKNNPFTNLGPHNLSAFLIVLEGVSHFCYLTWNASYDRPISRLDMELQAEIDKFICSSYLLHLQGNIVNHEQLWKMLFKHYQLNSQLNDEQLIRYKCASHYAGLYCQGIRRADNCLNSYKQIRRFYRLAGNKKFQFINNISESTLYPARPA